MLPYQENYYQKFNIEIVAESFSFESKIGCHENCKKPHCKDGDGINVNGTRLNSDGTCEYFCYNDHCGYGTDFEKPPAMNCTASLSVDCTGCKSRKQFVDKHTFIQKRSFYNC